MDEFECRLGPAGMSTSKLALWGPELAAPYCQRLCVSLRLVVFGNKKEHSNLGIAKLGADARPVRQDNNNNSFAPNKPDYGHQ